MKRSESIDMLGQAFSKAQGSFKELVSNDHKGIRSFANLKAVLDSVKEALSANGLSFYQYIDIHEQTNVSWLVSVVMHASGQWISTEMRMATFTSFRETYNSIESYRRISALLLLGIAASEGDPLLCDDNGTRELERESLEHLKSPDRKPKSEFVDTISSDQYKELMYELEGFESLVKQIQSFYKISSLIDLPKSEYYAVQGKIRQLKKTHEQYGKD